MNRLLASLVAGLMGSGCFLLVDAERVPFLAADAGSEAGSDGGVDAGPVDPCHDGQRNGTETDVDCGGDSCSPCRRGLNCLLDTDCRTKDCTNNGTSLYCAAAAHCGNGLLDPTETDVDCGGPECLGCPADKSCVDSGDCADGRACVGPDSAKVCGCLAGEGACDPSDPTRMSTCQPIAGQWVSSSCAVPTICRSGVPTPTSADCFDFCGEAAREARSDGCEFWAVPLPNSKLPAGFVGDAATPGQFAVVLVNPNPFLVGVQVKWLDAGRAEVDAPSDPASPLFIPAAAAIPGKLVVRLPSVGPSGSIPSYRLAASAPVTAYQFSPVQKDSAGVGANVAGSTQLLPHHALGKGYVAASLPHQTLTNNSTCASGTSCTNGFVCDTSANKCVKRAPGFVTIVAVEPGNTAVDVKLAAQVQAGLGCANASAGATCQLTLAQHDVVQLVTSENGYSVVDTATVAGVDIRTFPNVDLTGTLVAASQPVAVFSGSDWSHFPGTMNQRDHAEEQLPPYEAWGRTFVAAHVQSSQGPSSNLLVSKDRWRVIAGCGPASCVSGTDIHVYESFGTTVTEVNGAATPWKIPAVNASPGIRFLELEATGDFTLEASQPVLLAHYLPSGALNDPVAAGSWGLGVGPSLSFVAPIDSWAKAAAVAPSIGGEAWIIAALQGDSSTLSLNGSKLTSQQPATTAPGIGAGPSYQVLRVRVTDAALLTATAPFQATLFVDNAMSTSLTSAGSATFKQDTSRALPGDLTPPSP